MRERTSATLFAQQLGLLSHHGELRPPRRARKDVDTAVRTTVWLAHSSRGTETAKTCEKRTLTLLFAQQFGLLTLHGELRPPRRARKDVGNTVRTTAWLAQSSWRAETGKA